MPDIHNCDIFDQEAAEQQHQTEPSGGCLDISSGIVPIPSTFKPLPGITQKTTNAPDGDPYAAIAKPIVPAQKIEGLPKSAVVTPHTPSNKTTPTQNGSVMGGQTITFDLSQAKPVPVNKKPKPITFNLADAKPVTSERDAQGNPIPQPPSGSVVMLKKAVEMPDGSTSIFAGNVLDNAIKAQWNKAKTRQTLKAIAWAALITLAVTLLASYLFQIAYRALLYVVFGATVRMA